MENQIAKVTKSEISFSQTERMILNAQQTLKINQLSPESLLKLANQLIDDALIALGHKNTFQTDAEREAAHIRIADDLADYFQHYTVGDIKTAVRMGANGDFDIQDAVITFSPSRLVRWVKAYISVKHVTISKMRVIEEQERLDNVRKEQENINREFVKNSFSNLCEIVKNNAEQLDSNVFRFNNLYLSFYERLFKAGLIVQSKEEKWQILFQMRKYVQENATDLEKSWKRGDFTFFCNTPTKMEIYNNNYFHRTALYLAEQKCLIESLKDILSRKDAKKVLSKIEF